MLQSFVKAAENNENKSASAMHFELVRNTTTGKIIAIKRTVDSLDYDITRAKEVRGS